MSRLGNKNRRHQMHKDPKAPTSCWSSRVQSIFASIAQIPLVALSTACTLLGTVLIFAYQRSIDQAVTDFSALIGIAIAATLCAGAIVIATGFGLFVPALIVQVYARSADDGSESPIAFSPWELLSIQVFLVGIYVVYSESASILDCMEPPSLWWVLAVIASCLTGAFSLKRTLQQKTSAARLYRFIFTYLVGVAAFIPLVFLYALKDLFAGFPVQPAIAVLVVYVIVALLNIAAGSRAMRMLVVVAVAVALFILLWIPFAERKFAKFPTLVASAIGIRSEARTLGLPKATCLLVQRAAFDAGLMPPNSACDHDTWNGVKTRVLSNIGANWLLEFGLPLLVKPKEELVVFRVTVSAAGIQSSYLPPNAVTVENAKPTVCASAAIGH
jgi:hypothetical protein